MMPGFQRLFSRLGAIALLACVVLFVGFFVIAPVVGYFSDRREEITEQRRLLTRFSAAGGAAAQGGLPAKPAADSGIFLAGSSDALRLAELQSLTGRIAELEGVELRSTRSLPVREREGLRLLGLEANMRTTISQLQKVLYRIETGRPFVIVEDLQVTPPPLIAGEEQSGAGLLDVRLNLLSAATAKKG